MENVHTMSLRLDAADVEAVDAWCLARRAHGGKRPSRTAAIRTLIRQGTTDNESLAAIESLAAMMAGEIAKQVAAEALPILRRYYGESA